jgi:hypothetical protein
MFVELPLKKAILLLISSKKHRETLPASVGTQLAPDSDPDKAFSSTTKGTVLGVSYDTAELTWAIPQDKFPFRF